MAYEVKYRAHFRSKLGNEIQIDFLEDGYADEIIPITCGSVNLRYKDGDRDVYTPIKSSELALTILCNNQFTAENFLIDTAYELKVILYVNGSANWYGWLDTTDLQKKLLDTNHYIDLVAKDGLHILKTSEIKLPDGTPLRDVDSVINYLAFALRPTNLGLSILAFIDMYPEGITPTTGTLNYAKVHYSTFATGGITYDSCYDALEKIMHSFKCTFFQSEGSWIVISWEQLYDFPSNELYYDVYDSDGVIDSHRSTFTRDFFEIGLTKPHKLINKDALITWSQAADSVTTNFAYDPPINPILNSTWEFNTFNSPSGEYLIDYWTNILGADSIVNYKLDSENNLIRLSLEIPEDSAVRSPEFLVEQGDLFSVSCEVGNRVQFRVVLENGTSTKYLRPDGGWSDTILLTGDVTENTFNIETIERVPFNGRVHIDMLWGDRFLTFPSFVNNLKVTITPVISEEVTANGYFIKKLITDKKQTQISDDVFISSSNNHAVKGALLKYESSGTDDYYVSENYWNRGYEESGPYLFQDIQNLTLWKMNFRRLVRLEGRIFNCTQGNYYISPIAFVKFDAYATKRFCFGTLDVDIVKDTAEITAIEIRDTEISVPSGFQTNGLINQQDVEYDKIQPEKNKPLSWRWGPTGVIIQLITKKRWGKIR